MNTYFYFRSGVAALQIGSLIFLRIEALKQEGDSSDKDQKIGMIVSLYCLGVHLGGWIGSLMGGILYESLSFEGSALVIFFLVFIEAGGIVYLKHRA